MRTLATFLFCAASAYSSVGFQLVTVAKGRPIAAGIWYPSDAPASPHPLQLYTQNVAVNGTVSGHLLPLVVISHGVQGSLASHYDTAIALAQAGFVVAAVTHTGDNAQDQSYVANQIDLTNRPAEMRRMVDYMLQEWPARDQIDPARIGIFGHSLGGFTALVAIGGTPDLGEIPRFCATKSDAPECRFIQQNHGDQLSFHGPPIEWRGDSRIRAAVIAAPAVVFPFDKGRLRAADVPVQLWRVEDDQQAPDEWNSRIVREGLPRKPEEHVVRNAGHMVFRPCSDALAKAAPFVCQDSSEFDRVAFHQQLNRAVAAFFKAQLAR